VIAHEITHGFDDQGRMYDKDGMLTADGWMTAAASARFNTTAQCFVEQYGDFKVNDENVNGKLTLGENIADNGGLAGAYSAYTKASASEPPLPGVGLTNNQLFFVSFAQVWCGMSRPAAEHMSLLTDVHSPKKARVVGSAQNSAAFSEAFQCQPKSPMNPSDKCLLW
jgi:predicted metalloendopeptidase